jgi:hypothetical protein
MSKSYLELWFETLLKRPSPPLTFVVTVAGECDKHLGPTWQFARIKVSIEPATRFEVVDLVPNNEELRRSGYPDWAIFGLLDVLVLSDSFPIDKVRIVLAEADYSAVESSPMAFREAGRESGRKILEGLRSPRSNL